MCISQIYKKANIYILEEKKKRLPICKTGKSRLFQATLLLSPISLIAQQHICRCSDF